MAEIDILRWWSELMELPSVAIGGITAQNCRPLVEAGANFLAVSAAIWVPSRGSRGRRAGVQGRPGRLISASQSYAL